MWKGQLLSYREDTDFPVNIKANIGLYCHFQFDFLTSCSFTACHFAGQITLPPLQQIMPEPSEHTVRTHWIMPFKSADIATIIARCVTECPRSCTKATRCDSKTSTVRTVDNAGLVIDNTDDDRRLALLRINKLRGSLYVLLISGNITWWALMWVPQLLYVKNAWKPNSTISPGECCDGRRTR